MTSSPALVQRPSGPSVLPADLPRTDLGWTLHTDCPEHWWATLLRCGGGFFHTPAALAAVAPGGTPVFGQLVRGDEVVGVAAGVRHACGLSSSPRHAYFPAPPALICVPRREAAMAALREAVASAGGVAVTVDGFDAAWRPEATATDGEPEERLEYVVPVGPEAGDAWRRLTVSHRRALERGARERWTLRVHEGTEAWALLSPATRTAAGRVRLAASASAGDWGGTAFSAWDGDTPLAAALLGHANRRAYCLRTRVTPAGARGEAEVWLHWRILGALAARDVDSYNLGWTGATAGLASDPGHALFRLRMGFRPELTRCRAVRWTLRHGHMQAHDVAPWHLPRRAAHVA